MSGYRAREGRIARKKNNASRKTALSSWTAQEDEARFPWWRNNIERMGGGPPALDASA